jgi:hypothetical protein
MSCHVLTRPCCAASPLAPCPPPNQIINETLDGLIAKCKALVEEEDADFGEDFLSERDPSILHFLLASGGGREQAAAAAAAGSSGSSSRQQ